MFIVFISIVQGIIFLGHFIIYKTFLTFIAPGLYLKPNLLWTVRIMFIFLAVSFVLSYSLTFREYSELGRMVYFAAAVWLGTVWFLFLASLLIVGLKLNPAIAAIIFIGAIFVSGLSLLNSFNLKVKTVEVAIPNLPDEWKGRKAVVFADSHFGNIRGQAFNEKLSNVVISSSPDIVFIIGDVFDGPPLKKDVLQPFLKMTDPQNIPLGVYYVNGNHEMYGDTSGFLRMLEGTGINILSDQKVNVRGVDIIGIEYKEIETEKEYSNTLSSLEIGDNPTILLKHVPSLVHIPSNFGVDLSLHGHSHNGQMWPFKYLARRIYKGFEYGLKKSGDMHVLTTSGAGTWGPPQRFFTQSEIVEVVFR
jgi:uncharacterized protein